MSFFIADLGNKDNQLNASSWEWRPTVEIIRSFNILAEERIELLHMQTVGDTVTAIESRQIGEKIRLEILHQIPVNGRLLLDLSVTTEPDDGTMYYGSESEKNYSATAKWLAEFADFCLMCEGFQVL